MHYVSWDRSDKNNLKLYVEGGPETLGEFQHDRAVVDGEVWELVSSAESGAVATRASEEIVRAQASLKRDKTIPLEVEGRTYTLVNEGSKNWVVNDSDDNKVAQFTQDHNGVRQAILEFEGETHLSTTDVAALAWISREVLESKKMVNSSALIAFLVFLSIFTVVVFLLQ